MSARTFGEALAAQQGRFVLWLPVLFGIGIASYFALPAEPPLAFGAAGFALSLTAVAGALWRWPAALPCVLALAAATGGFFAVQARSAAVDAPKLEREMTAVYLEGQIVEIEEREDGKRLVIQPAALGGLESADMPAKVRVWTDGGPYHPGQWIRSRAILRPPPGPVIPGGFDFARLAYFERLGGVGFLIGEAEVGRVQERPALALFWPRARAAIGARLQEALPDEAGAVARALVTGERGAIPEQRIEQLRDAGLAHLLAISGLHLGLVTGTVFFGLRAGLALAPGVALRHPIKKWAAVGALCAGAAYLLLVGVTVPAQRAFIMAGLVFLAVLFDRSPFSMRLVAVGAFAVLLLRPESLLSASFQMSFAAVTALVAAFESGAGRLPLGEGRSRGLAAQIALYLAVVAVTSVIAIIATAPFAMLQFNRLALFGLAANLVAVPATALIIMPSLLVAVIVMPLGMESLPLVAAGWGIDLVLRVAETVSGWQGAVVLIPRQPDWVLPLVVLGGLWICLWRGAVRFLGLAPVVVAAALWPMTQSQPNLIIGRQADTFALTAPNSGLLILSAPPEESYESEQWLRLAGARDYLSWDEAPEGVLACDVRGCVYRPAPGRIVALVDHPGAADEDCRVAEVVVYRFRLWQACGAPPFGPLVLDSRAFREGGGHALYATPTGWRIESVEEKRGAHPWTRGGQAQ